MKKMKSKLIEYIKEDALRILYDDATDFTEQLADNILKFLAVEFKNPAYGERNQLVLFLTKCYPSYLGRHAEEDKEWENDWKNIIYIESPAGQLSWHIHDSELPMFEHLPSFKGEWDHHTSEEKYGRLRSLRPRLSVTGVMREEVKTHE